MTKTTNEQQGEARDKWRVTGTLGDRFQIRRGSRVKITDVDGLHALNRVGLLDRSNIVTKPVRWDQREPHPADETWAQRRRVQQVSLAMEDDEEKES